METWSCPETETQAIALDKLMANPILQQNASLKLYHLMGDDELFGDISLLEPNHDVRYLVVLKLKVWLSRLHIFITPWEPKAIEICQQITKIHSDDRSDYNVF